MDMTTPTWKLPSTFKNTYLLEFTNPLFNGLKIRVQRITLAGLATSAGLSEIDLESVKTGKVTKIDLMKVCAVVREFAKCIVEWNYVDDVGNVYPHTYEFLSRQDILLLLYLVDAWTMTLAQSYTETETQDSLMSTLDKLTRYNVESIPSEALENIGL